MFYAYDGLGSVAALSNHQGKLKTRYQYDTFGEVLAGDLSDNPYAFTGQRLDPESSLYHFHFRKYDAETGVWATADPSGIFGGINLYLYVNNNPINQIDILGLFADAEGMDDTRSPGSLEDAHGEGDRGTQLLALGTAAFAEPSPFLEGVFVATVVVMAVDSIITWAKQTDDDEEDTERTPDNNRPIDTGQDALDQLEGIEKAQQDYRKGKRERPIDCTDKSKQRLDNKLKGYSTPQDVYDDFDW